MTTGGILAAGSTGSAPPAWPVSPKMWYLMNDLTGYVNGATAPTTIADKTGNGFTGTKVGSDVVVAVNTTPKGTTGIQFNGFGNANPAGYNFASLSGMTAASAFVVLARQTASSVNVGPWNLRSGDGSYYTYSDGNVYEGAFTDSGATRAVFAQPSTAFQVYHIAVGGGTLQAYVNNVLKASTTYTTFTAPTAPCIGRTTVNAPVDKGWCGIICEFVLFDSVLSSTDRTTVVNTLTARHL